MDTATSDIRAVVFTPSSDGDSPVLPELRDQIPEGEEIGTVTADGAYDTRRWGPPSTARQCMFACTRGIDRQITAILPIRKNGRPWKEDCPAARVRNETLRATRHYGRAFRKHPTRYHARSRIEANPLMVCKQTISCCLAGVLASRDGGNGCDASRPSAPPRSFAWPDVSGETGSHASGVGSATTPIHHQLCTDD